jgi:N-acetylglucosaminylphosphatidylinositol deacetylase
LITSISSILNLQANHHRLYALQSASSAPSELNITLLIAHPDDEAMFFAPTLLALAPHNNIHVLCLSTGDADGLGSIRQQELKESCKLLGIDDVDVIDDPELPDSMGVTWPADKIGSMLDKYADKAGIVLTFDHGGVSGHVNHRSLYHGAKEWTKKGGKRLWSLETLGLVRKYGFTMDAFVAPAPTTSGMRFVSGIEGVRKAQRAMTDAHKSQMRWFRWGWIGLSRYMVVNDVKEVSV